MTGSGKDAEREVRDRGFSHVFTVRIQPAKTRSDANEFPFTNR